MSTSAVIPRTSADFGASSASPSQQSVFQGLISQLEQSISGGDLTVSQTYLNAIEAASPSSAGADTALGTFLTSVGSALDDGSVSEAQSALTAYLSASPTTQSTSSTTSTDSSSSAVAIASGLVLSQVQLNLVSSQFGVDSPSTDTGTDSSSSSLGSLLNILNAAYGSDEGSSSNTSSSATSTSATSASPYDALVSAIQSSLAEGSGIANPELAYLNSTGNFVNTSA
jgi:hypothetical protein